MRHTIHLRIVGKRWPLCLSHFPTPRSSAPTAPYTYSAASRKFFAHRPGAWRYDPSTDSWDELQPLPAPRGGFSAAVVAGKIYAVGGHARAIQELSTLEAYDISNDRWETLAPMPTPRVISAAGVVRSKIVVAGGLSTRKGRNLNANEIYDPIADEWRAANPMPTTRGGIAAAVIEDRMYVLGGGNPLRTFPNNEIYDIDSDLWSAGQPMTVGRHGLAAVAIGRRIYASRRQSSNPVGGATARRTRFTRPEYSAEAGSRRNQFRLARTA